MTTQFDKIVQLSGELDTLRQALAAATERAERAEKARDAARADAKHWQAQAHLRPHRDQVVRNQAIGHALNTTPEQAQELLTELGRPHSLHSLIDTYIELINNGTRPQSRPSPRRRNERHS